MLPIIVVFDVLLYGNSRKEAFKKCRKVNPASFLAIMRSSRLRLKVTTCVIPGETRHSANRRTTDKPLDSTTHECTPMKLIKFNWLVVGLSRSIPTTNPVGLLPGGCTLTEGSFVVLWRCRTRWM